jgi:hypothetical protein
VTSEWADRAARHADKEDVMKIGAKLLALWVASLALYIGIAVASWLRLDVMEGVSGLMIRFFLGYCGIIVVSQVFAVLEPVRKLANDLMARNPQQVGPSCVEPGQDLNSTRGSI